MLAYFFLDACKAPWKAAHLNAAFFFYSFFSIMEKVCPHCHETIDELFYSADVREYGTCQVDGRYPNCTDSNFDSCDYQCPKCERSVEIDDLLDEVPDEEEDEETEETPSIEEGGSICNVSTILLEAYASGKYEDRKALASCKRCKIQLVLFEGHATGHSQNCPKCGKTTLTSII